LSDTNRNQDYLCVLLEDEERQDLLSKIIAFAVNLRCYLHGEKEVMAEMQRRIVLYKRWWESYGAAEWVRDFGADLNDV